MAFVNAMLFGGLALAALGLGMTVVGHALVRIGNRMRDNGR